MKRPSRMKLPLTALLAVIFMTSYSQEQLWSDFSNAKPFTRWWWFAGETDTNDIRYQLDWLAAHEFGGVEIAWVYPMNGDTTAPRHAWLSRDWTKTATYAKQYANSIGLACDFTFGTLWPFGDSQVPPDEGSLQYPDTIATPTMRLTWEHPVKGTVLDHLNPTALEHYGQRMISGLRPALLGAPSALFCDSWEVDTRKLWTRGLDREFSRIYGYDISRFMDSLYVAGYERQYYDYRKLVSDYILYGFYGPLTSLANRYGSFTRVQCGGSPTDLLTAFSLVDVPETEAMLFEPAFARIPASAALLSSKPLVSAEAFTCLYGWKGWPGPGPYQGSEQVADLKLVADALFANGVNLIVWHGTPFNGPNGTNRFYASVHVGEEAGFIRELAPFNKYLETVTSWMRTGIPYTSLATYLPLEDAWMGVEYPDSLQYPWAWGEYELRYVTIPEEIRGYQPVWVNQQLLFSFKIDEQGNFYCGKHRIPGLYIDAAWMDFETVEQILVMAQKGLPVCLKRDPAEPGTRISPEYDAVVAALNALPNVSRELSATELPPPVLEGDDLPEFWCREDGQGLLIFLANPATRNLKFPLTYGQSFTQDTVEQTIRINYYGFSVSHTLTFAPYESLLLKVHKHGMIESLPIGFTPSTPVSSE